MYIMLYIYGDIAFLHDVLWTAVKHSKDYEYMYL